jgi:phenylacetate-CoA ligase
MDRITARGVDLASCRKFNTAGSTGKPFTVYLTRGDLRTRCLVEFRSLLSMGFSPLDRLSVLGLALPRRLRLHQRLGLYRSDNITLLLSLEDQILRLQRMNPTVLWAYPTVLRALLQTVGFRLSKIVRPSKLITSAEVLDDITMERIRADLEPDMFNFYGSIEVGRVAAECRSHEGLHVNMDHVILECLAGDNGSPKQRNSGIAVLTTLNTFVIPFIRYRLGDICTFIEKKCSCGLSFPLIGPPSGREDDIVKLPSGKIISPLPFIPILWNISGIEQFRIIQHSLDHFVLQLARRENLQDGILSKVRSAILNYLGEPVRLDIQIVDFIQEEKLKLRAFISKLPKSDL